MSKDTSGPGAVCDVQESEAADSKHRKEDVERRKGASKYSLKGSISTVKTRHVFFDLV